MIKKLKLKMKKVLYECDQTTGNATIPQNENSFLVYLGLNTSRLGIYNTKISLNGVGYELDDIHLGRPNYPNWSVCIRDNREQDQSPAAMPEIFYTEYNPNKSAPQKTTNNILVLFDIVDGNLLNRHIVDSPRNNELPTGGDQGMDGTENTFRTVAISESSDPSSFTNVFGDTDNKRLYSWALLQFSHLQQPELVMPVTGWYTDALGRYKVDQKLCKSRGDNRRRYLETDINQQDTVWNKLNPNWIITNTSMLLNGRFISIPSRILIKKWINGTLVTVYDESKSWTKVTSNGIDVPRATSGSKTTFDVISSKMDDGTPCLRLLNFPVPNLRPMGDVDTEINGRIVNMQKMCFPVHDYSPTLTDAQIGENQIELNYLTQSTLNSVGSQYRCTISDMETGIDVPMLYKNGSNKSDYGKLWTKVEVDGKFVKIWIKIYDAITGVQKFTDYLETEFDNNVTSNAYLLINQEVYPTPHIQYTVVSGESKYLHSANVQVYLPLHNDSDITPVTMWYPSKYLGNSSEYTRGFIVISATNNQPRMTNSYTTPDSGLIGPGRTYEQIDLATYPLMTQSDRFEWPGIGMEMKFGQNHSDIPALPDGVWFKFLFRNNSSPADGSEDFWVFVDQLSNNELEFKLEDGTSMGKAVDYVRSFEQDRVSLLAEGDILHISNGYGQIWSVSPHSFEPGRPIPFTKENGKYSTVELKLRTRGELPSLWTY